MTMTSHYDDANANLSAASGRQSTSITQATGAYAGAQALLALVDEVRGLRADLTQQAVAGRAVAGRAAAGPRVGDILTTPEELEALPNGALVVDSDGSSWQRGGKKWVVVGNLEVAPAAFVMSSWGPVVLAWLPSGS